MTIDIGNLFYLKTIGQKHHMYMYLLAAVNKKHWCLRMYFLIFFYQHMKNAYTRICWIKEKYIYNHCCFLLCTSITNIHGEMILLHILYTRGIKRLACLQKKIGVYRTAGSVEAGTRLKSNIFFVKRIECSIWPNSVKV